MSFVIGLTVALVAIGSVSLYGAANSASKESAHTHIGLDAVRGNVYEGAVGELTLNDGMSITSCTASFVGPAGQVLSAVHCLQQPAPCDFNPVAGEYPLSSGEVFVDVASVNGTGEKWTFPATVLGWSGITDVLVLQLSPLVKGDESVITLTSQPYLKWGSNRRLERGEDARSLSFDLAFLKKLGHKGPVLHPYADRGSSFAVSTEQVFVDLNAEDGSSGSAVLDSALQVVMAPLSYGWFDNSCNLYAVSGTSSDVSGPLVRRIVRGDEPNGPANRKFLVPSLGIIPQYVMSGINMQSFFDGAYSTVLENKGIIFFWLAVQGYYEFLTIEIFDCGFPEYEMIPPSLEGAPLTETISGNPLDPFQDFPAFDGDTLVLLTAIERQGQWVELGEDAGLETISGVIASAGKWVGDDIRVRIKSANPFDLSNPDSNWEGIYTVTLLPIDPFWDTIQSGPFINYASVIRVNKTQGAPTQMHYDAGMVRHSKLLTNKRPLHKGKRVEKTRKERSAGGGGSITDAPAGVDITTLPTLHELYLKHRADKQQKGAQAKNAPTASATPASKKA
jgi:hypothetical protein